VLGDFVRDRAERLDDLGEDRGELRRPVRGQRGVEDSRTRSRPV
jgi:hypothetical protein